MIKIGQIWKHKEKDFRILILVVYDCGMVEGLIGTLSVCMIESEVILKNYDLVGEFDLDPLVKKLYGGD